MVDFKEYYEEYKFYSANTSKDMKQLKSNVMNIVERKQLVSVMNDTKWLKLQFEINNNLAFPPAFISKYITDKMEPDTLDFEKQIPRYYGNWLNYYEEGLPPLYNIEWLEVYPKFEKHQGQLIQGQVIDASEEFEAILYKLNIPFDKKKGIYKIWGYK
jgi:hypothetical protein